MEYNVGKCEVILLVGVKAKLFKLQTFVACCCAEGPECPCA